MNDRALSFAAVIVIAAAVIAAGIINALFFRSFEVVNDESAVISVSDSKAEFDEIEKKLLNSEKFIALKKIGTESLLPEKIKTGKTNPF